MKVDMGNCMDKKRLPHGTNHQQFNLDGTFFFLRRHQRYDARVLPRCCCVAQVKSRQNIAHEPANHSSAGVVQASHIPKLR